MADKVDGLREALDSLLDSKHDALPSDFNTTRFSENCVAYVNEINDLHRHSASEIAIVLLKGAILGLDFLARECHVVFDNGKPKFQTDYKGEMKLAKKYSVRRILDIYAKNVREGDDFREVIAEGRPTVHFVPVAFNNSKIVGTFAVALFQDGGMIYETMPAEEIESIRQNYSKNSTSSTWEKSQGEMYKRTALRRLCKTIEIDFNTEQVMAFESGGAFDFSNKPRPKQRSPFDLDQSGEEAAPADESDKI